MTDVLIVGGGPAGLNAALVLGRCRRNVTLCDSGIYRNAAAKAMHGFITRNGIPPHEFLSIAQQELSAYENIIQVKARVESIQPADGHFIATLSDGQTVIARKVVLATGIIDNLPSIEGARVVYGHGLHHCPYCDGYEVRDQFLAVYGRGDSKGAGMALELTQWSRSIILCTDGASEISSAMLAKLDKFSIPVDERKIKRLDKTEEGLRIQFTSGFDIHCKAMFFNTSTHKGSELQEKLGCDILPSSDHSEQVAGKTCVPGIYVIGDASRDVLQVIAAAAEGSAAAIALNNELLRDDGVLPEL
jgi:thioredoxin reductase